METIEPIVAARSQPRHTANSDSHHTYRRMTLSLALLAALAVMAITQGCGGGSGGGNQYRAALKKQESCCDHLADKDERAACSGEIRRIDVPAEETAAVNQETYYCVNQHFVCDARSGKASQASAQHQLDCINEADQL